MFDRLGLNRNLTILCSTIAVNVFARFMWDPLLPLHLRALGANDWELGISFTLMTIARTFISIVGGAMGDRYGRKLMLTVPAFAMVPLFFIAAASDSWLIVVVAFILLNALNALFSPAFNALTIESSDPKRVAQAYSLTELGVIVGMIGGPIAGALLLSRFDIRSLMALNGFVFLATTTLRAFGLRETAQGTRGMPLPKVRAAFDARVRWFIVMASLITMAFTITFGPFFAILARDAWHNSESEINLLFAAGNVAALGGIWLGRLSDRWGAHRVLVLGIGAYAVSAVAWGIAPNWQLGLIPLMIAFGFSEGAFIAQQTLQARITSPETRSSVFGIIASVSGVVGGLGPTIGAWLITIGGNAMPFVAVGVMGMLSLAALIPIQQTRTVAQVAASGVKAE